MPPFALFACGHTEQDDTLLKCRICQGSDYRDAYYRRVRLQHWWWKVGEALEALQEEAGIPCDWIQTDHVSLLILAPETCNSLLKSGTWITVPHLLDLVESQYLFQITQLEEADSAEDFDGSDYEDEEERSKALEEHRDYARNQFDLSASILQDAIRLFHIAHVDVADFPRISRSLELPSGIAYDLHGFIDSKGYFFGVMMQFFLE